MVFLYEFFPIVADSKSGTNKKYMNLMHMSALTKKMLHGFHVFGTKVLTTQSERCHKRHTESPLMCLYATFICETK